MLVADAIKAVQQILSAPFRRVLLTAVASTIGLLLLVWFGLTRLIAGYLAGHPLGESYWWAETAGFFLAGFGLLVGLVFLIPPVTSLVAGFFLDDVARAVEAQHYPADEPGRDVPLLTSVGYGARFALASVLLNLLAFALILLPGVNLLVFYLANGYLQGRQYFEAAAARFHPPETVRALRLAHGGQVFLGGLLIAVLVSIPVANLLTPLFGTALMVHLHKRLMRRRLAAPSAARAG